MLQDIQKTLWATADKLRANMDAAEYKHLVLGLIFVKYISDTFAAHHATLVLRLADPDDEYFYGDADPADIAAELEDRDYYKEANVFWVPEAARWEQLRSSAKQPDIGKRIDDALTLIEAENPTLKGILDKRYARAQLPDGKLGELVDLVSTIGFGDTPDVARDTLGQVYEYFLGMFASAEGKRGGQFYTPASIVKTLVAVLNPHTGKVYDPCCGSGGMFVQSEKFIEAHGGKKGDVSIYGQESNPTTWRLAAMNLAIRGIDFNLGREPADMDGATAALFPDSLEESELGWMPKGWRVGRLDDLLILQRGFDLPAQDRIPGEVPIIAASGPSGTHQEAMVQGPGVVTGRSGVLGRVFLEFGPYWPLNTTLWIKEFRAATPCFAYELLRLLDFKSFNAGSAVPTLNRNHIHGLAYLVPSRASVEAFEDVASMLHQRVKANEQQAETLSTLRDTLLPRLISGQLRLPEALAEMSMEAAR